MKSRLIENQAFATENPTSRQPSSWPRRWLLAGLAVLAPVAQRVKPSPELVERDGWLLNRDDN